MNVSPDQKPAKAAVHRLLAAFDSIAVPAMEAPPIAPLQFPVEPVAVKAEPVAEIKPADEKPSEVAPAVEKAPDAPVPEIEAAETQITDVKPSEAETQAKAAEVKTAEDQPAGAEPVEVKPVEATLLEAKPVDTKPVDLKPVDSSMAALKPAEAKPAPVLVAKMDATESGAPKPPRAKPLDAKSAEAEFSLLAITPASKRFRESASAQVAAARERIAQRNLSGAMTMALALGVLSAGVAGGGGYLAGLSEKSATHAVALEQSVMRIEAEMVALRIEVERTARRTSADAGETGERLSRIERAQAEPLAKLSKLAEMIEKLRSVQVSTAAASKIDVSDVTGSVSQQQGGKGRSSAATVVEAWVLREFDKDVALIEGKRGLLEISVGDDIPGLGRVEGFRKHDGRWAVVTSKGLITSR